MTGAIKLQVLRAGLAVREHMSDEFAVANYLPLEVEGPLRRHVVAFARTSAAGSVVVVGTRFSLRLLDRDLPLVSADRWDGTRIVLPHSMGQLHDVMTHRPLAENATVEVRSLLRDLPIAILRS